MKEKPVTKQTADIERMTQATRDFITAWCEHASLAYLTATASAILEADTSKRTKELAHDLVYDVIAAIDDPDRLEQLARAFGAGSQHDA